MAQLLITTEDDGSQWVMLEDYQSLHQKYLLGELVMKELLIKNSVLLNENNRCKDLLHSICETVSEKRYGICAKCAESIKKMNYCDCFMADVPLTLNTVGNCIRCGKPPLR